MILAYIFAFLMLFALLSNNFLQKYNAFKISEIYFPETYDAYIHRPSDLHLSGFNIKDLLDQQSVMRPLFIQTINIAYTGSEFHYNTLGQELLNFFEERIELNEGQSKNNGKSYIESAEDLRALSLNKQSERFKIAYFHLMESSKIDHDSAEGFISLIDLLHPVIAVKQGVFNLYSIDSALVQALFEKDSIVEDLKASLQRLRLSSDNSQENARNFYNDFISRHRLQQHPNLKLVHFQFPDPVSQ